MTKTFTILNLTAGLLAGALFSACTRDDNGLATAAVSEANRGERSSQVQSAFVKEVMALKARESDPVKLEAGINDIIARYGVPGGARTVPGTKDAVFVDERFSDGNAAPAASLGKTAAAQASHWYMAKSVSFGQDSIEIAQTRSMTIRAGCTVTLYTTHNPASNADPYVVIYSTPAGANQNFSTVTILSVDDDGGGNLDARAVWTNSTGQDQWVTFTAHAYAPSTTGSGTMNITCKKANGGSCGNYSQSGYIGGVVVRGNSETPASGCTGPSASNISLSVNAPLTHPSLLAVNRSKMRGGFIFGNNAGSLLLDDVLTNNFSQNYILAYTDGYTHGSGNTGFQGNKYTCP